MLNIIKSRKRKLNHGQHIYWHDTFNWEERDTRKKMLNFAKKMKKYACLASIDHIILSLNIYSFFLIHFDDRINYTNKPETSEETDCAGK